MNEVSLNAFHFPQFCTCELSRGRHLTPLAEVNLAQGTVLSGEEDKKMK